MAEMQQFFFFLWRHHLGTLYIIEYTMHLIQKTDIIIIVVLLHFVFVFFLLFFLSAEVNTTSVLKYSISFVQMKVADILCH